MSEYRLLVAIANPSSVEPLARMGCTLAAANDGTVEFASVTPVPGQVPVSDAATLTARQEAIVDRALSVAEAFGVPAEDLSPAGREPERSIARLVDRGDASAVLLGAQGETPFERSLLGDSPPETVTDRVACDVYVEQIGPGPAVPSDSILVPVAAGQHAEAAVRVASSIAAVHGTMVHLVTVLPPAADADEWERAGARLRTLADGTVGPAVRSEVVTGDDVVGTLVPLTGEHGLTVLGATEWTAVRQLVSGTVPAGLARRSRNTLLMVDGGTGG